MWAAQMMACQTMMMPVMPTTLPQRPAVVTQVAPVAPVPPPPIVKPGECTNPNNTTFIGDMVFSALMAQQKSWLVQIIGEMTLQTAVDLVSDNTLDVQPHNIFIGIGTNQVYTAMEHGNSEIFE